MMHGCLRFLHKSKVWEKNSPQRNGTGGGGVTTKPDEDKTDYPAVPAYNFNSFSSSTALNPAVDSSQTPETHSALSQRNLPTQDIDNESKFDLDAAIRAVDVALAGLQVGGRRQGSPTTITKQEVQTPTPTRSRPGCPPKAAAALPRAIRRIARFVTTNPQERGSFPDAFPNMQQQMPYQPTRHNSQDFMLNSGDLLNQSYAGYIPNAADMRSNFSESDMQNAAVLWGAGGGNAPNQTSEEWNVQQQLQHLIGQTQGLTMPPHQLPLQNGVGRNWSADFTSNPQLTKYMTNNGISEFLMNSSDSWSSKIAVPQQGSGRGDSFSSKIEFPVNCDSFTSKLSTASMRDDSFTSQRLVDPILLNKPVESIADSGIETEYNMPERMWQELESLAEGGEMTKGVTDATSNVPVLTEAHSRSEKNLLQAISGILRCALLGSFSKQGLVSDLNFLIASVRKHFMDFQTFSSSAAETFLLIGSTLPVVCITASFNEDVLSSLEKFMMLISAGHPTLNNAACLLQINQAMELTPAQRNEAFQLLTKIHQKLTNELSTNTNNAAINTNATRNSANTSSAVPISASAPPQATSNPTTLTSPEIPNNTLDAGSGADVTTTNAAAAAASAQIVDNVPESGSETA